MVHLVSKNLQTPSSVDFHWSLKHYCNYQNHREEDNDEKILIARPMIKIMMIIKKTMVIMLIITWCRPRLRMPRPQPTTSERQQESGTFSLSNVIVIIYCAHLLLVWQFCYCYHFMCSHVTVIIIVYVWCAPGRKGCVDPVCVALSAATLQLRNHQYDH